MPRNGIPLYLLQPEGAAQRPALDRPTGVDDSSARLAQDYDCFDDVGFDQGAFFGIQTSYGAGSASATTSVLASSGDAVGDAAM
eukprot:6572568-Pyramimonas_sp.AAC.1